MEIAVVDDAGAPRRLLLTGRLDAAGTEAVEMLFADKVRTAPGDVLVDLSGVGFVGSLGIRMLLSAARLADRAGRRVVICGAQPAVAEVFHTVALDELIPVLPDAGAALAHLAA